MRKLLGGLILLLALVAVLAAIGLVVAIPRYVPPYVERLIAEKIGAFGFKSTVRLDLSYYWRSGPEIDGRLFVSIPKSPWRTMVRMNASRRGWTASAELPQVNLREDDPVLADLLRRYPQPTVSNLTFSGTIAMEAKARGGYLFSVPEWEVTVPIRDVSADFFVEDRAVSLDGLNLTPAASGLASHVDIRPTFVRATSLAAGNVLFTNVYASVHASEKSLLLTEAGAGFCGGKVTLYSLFLDMKSLNAGFTLFADDVDAGEALRHFNGFHGEASGLLHGKLRLFVKEGGRSIRLNDAFLYSTPGETGKLRMENPDEITENLAYAGLDDKTRQNVSDALTDLDYTALKLAIRRGKDKSATLTTHISGTATRGKLTVPVDLTLNFHGDIEQLINLGLNYSKKMKGQNP